MRIGDYVRTDKGLIGKVIKKEEYDTHFILEYKGQYCKRVLTTSETDSEIIKSSPNIIDILEVGDYVNGYRVIDFDYSVANTRIRIWVDTENEINYIFKNDIKSIVTKEQFKNMEYEVK